MLNSPKVKVYRCENPDCEAAAGIPESGNGEAPATRTCGYCGGIMRQVQATQRPTARGHILTVIVGEAAR